MEPRPAAGTLIVGRDPERTLLRQQLDDVLDGRGGMTLISGEAGIGKTTLVGELGHVAVARGVRVRTGHCYDLSTTPPYGPWLDALGATTGEPNLPPTPALSSNQPPPAGASSQLARFEDLVSTIGALTSERPLLLLLEDLHWADPMSLELLRFVGRAVADSRLLILGTYRDTDIEAGSSFARLMPTLVNETRPERIALRRLDRDAIGALIRSRYELAIEDEAALSDYLMRYTEGNPFFLTENTARTGAKGCLGSRSRYLGDEACSFAANTSAGTVAGAPDH